MKKGRFDYVKYDDEAVEKQARAKAAVENLEEVIEHTMIGCSRAKALALTKLEEVYMWIGKGMRDDQIMRNGSAPLQEERINS